MRTFLRALSRLDLLLVFVPLGLLLDKATNVDKAWVFLICALAIVPLAGIIGRATEQLSDRAGPGIGGLLNATFGNASELIVAIVALRAGKTEIVQASLTGSIIGNLLFVFGLAAFVGGLRREKQTLNATAASVSNSSLHLAVIGTLIPSVLFTTAELRVPEIKDREQALSFAISLVLLVLYALGLIFSLKTHRHLYAEEETMAAADLAPSESLSRKEADDPEWPIWVAVLVLLGASVLVGAVSESLVGAVERAVDKFHMAEAFVGVVVLAIVGNAAEHSTAVMMAYKNKMALAHSIATESSKQIALFVIPLCVLLGYFLVPHGARPMTLHFSLTEVVAAYASVLVINQILADGETNWLEGAQLLGLYVVLAATFYFVH
jgi:Ca2+:H+ antiporter